MLILHFRGVAPYQQLSLIQLFVPATPLIHSPLDSLRVRLLEAHKCTSAGSYSSFDVYNLFSVSSPSSSSVYVEINLVYESGGRKEMEADPEEDKHCLI